MGCDIHLFLEYRHLNNSWRNFGGPLNPGRNYNLFAALAGVRGGGAGAIPKGLPDDIGCVTKYHNEMCVVDKEPLEENCISLAVAEKWVASGASKFTHGKSKVTHPDWHSHSWSTVEEFRQAVNKNCPGNVEYAAILSAAESLQRNTDYTVRFVYWFDN